MLDEKEGDIVEVKLLKNEVKHLGMVESWYVPLLPSVGCTIRDNHTSSGKLFVEVEKIARNGPSDGKLKLGE